VPEAGRIAMKNKILRYLRYLCLTCLAFTYLSCDYITDTFSPRFSCQEGKRVAMAEFKIQLEIERYHKWYLVEFQCDYIPEVFPAYCLNPDSPAYDDMGSAEDFEIVDSKVIAHIEYVDGKLHVTQHFADHGEYIYDVGTPLPGWTQMEEEELLDKCHMRTIER